MRLGVIIGRFQTPYLHEGHKHLIDTAYNENNRVMILLGTKSDSDGGTDDERNPYSFIERVVIVRKDYPDALIYKLTDVPEDDSVWSQRVDEIIENVMDIEGYNTATLYHSRDSFKDYYSGNITTVEVPQIVGVSSTQIREQIKNNNG